ncbi:MAG TPA: DRTGG domain-containing protein [Syntrophales bacterium]|nr:DRTGG domain-containing protein [Syntrophales bacterium]HOL59810.1 DRTGG domain-containing protein [Syntrophales bacterium]HPO35972.1 DRTGG domain-containing protein [Syntrophales bacterium]
MKLIDIARELDLKVRAAAEKMEKEVSGGYVGDLLSDVMGNAREGQVWITRQTHQNIVAVADLKDLAGIVLVNRCEPLAETVEKANEVGMPILVSSFPAFELAGRIYILIAKAKGVSFL